MGRASLKPVESLEELDEDVGFPGPMGRASLKRSLPAAAWLPLPRISRPYGPGLIEARSGAFRLYSYRLISRPYGPGLIEASSARLAPTLAGPRFPGPMGRASLKHQLLGLLLSSLQGFPGPMGRASLKPVSRWTRPGGNRRFPGPMGRASLKRGPRSRPSRGAKMISRPYGPGLIEA